MNVVSAWQLGYTGQGVVVTILDDGIEHNHTDLQRNYVSSSRLLFLLRRCYMWFEIKLFQNYFRGLLQLVNISNVFTVAEIILK